MKNLSSMQKALLLVFAGVIAVSVYLLFKPNSDKLSLPVSSPSAETISDKFPNFKIPEDMTNIELKDVANTGSTGFATRKFENGKFELIAIADLVDPETGFVYQGWLADLTNSQKPVYLSLGTLRLAKGGWLLEYTSGKDYSVYKTVIISKEKKAGSLPSQEILKGSF